MSDTPTRQALNVLPPRAAQQFLATTSNSAATVNLALLGPQTQAVNTKPLQGDPGAANKYVTVTAISADVYVAFANASATVGSITATTTGTNAANTAFPIFAGTSKDFRLESGDTWMGYVTASGTGYIHVYISSNR